MDTPSWEDWEDYNEDWEDSDWYHDEWEDEEDGYYSPMDELMDMIMEIIYFIMEMIGMEM